MDALIWWLEIAPVFIVMGLLVFWLVVLIDCLINESQRHWILSLVLGNVVGAFYYVIHRRGERIREDQRRPRASGGSH